jgi:hypothetical protein
MIRGNAMTLELKYPAPIPVGHRVEVLWVQRNVSLFAKEPSWETIDGYCAVKDLDTGIEHGMTSDFAGLDQQHPIAARLKAKVVWCRLVTRFEGTQQHTETRLFLEPEEGAPPRLTPRR